MTSKILDSTTDELREKLIIAMAKMASQGSVPAATAAVKMINELERLDAARNHNEIMVALKDSPIFLCKYLGRIGESKERLKRHLGRNISTEEELAWKDGVEDRRLEIRAIELGNVTRGGKVEDWMKR